MLNANTLRAEGSDGSTGIFATPCGLVGTPGPSGAWYFWLPQIGVIFDAEYWGMRVTISRDSGNTYLYSPDGGASMSSHQYAARWRGSPYYDVSGAPISSPADATDTRDPSQVANNRMLELGPANVPDVAPPPGAGSPNPDMWTRGTDGSTDIYPSPSGMVGKINASGAWVMFVPAAGVTYDAQYWGMRVSLLNNGDGSYMLAVDGQRSAHVYADKWEPGQYYDYRGREISSPAKATTVADPLDVYFETGQYLTAPPPSTAVLPPAAGPAQPPAMSPTYPQPVTRPPTTGPAQPPVITQPGAPSYGGGSAPAQPPVITRPPTSVQLLPYTPVPTTAPPAPASIPGASTSGGAQWWPVAAAAGLLLMMRRKR